MLGVDGKFSFTASALLACAIATGGCGGTDAPGAVHLGLVSAANVTTESITISSDNTSPSKLQSALVTVKEIDAHVKGHDWKPLMTAPVSVDLFHLDQQRMTGLGLGQLPAGQIDKLRLVLDGKAYVVDSKGNKSELELPDNNIIEVIGRLDLDSCAAGTLILDFDPKITTASKDECCDHSKCNNGGDHYVLRCRATIKTEEVHGQCDCDGGTTTTPPPPTGQQCGNGNTVCDPDQICRNGDCVDPCAGVTCGCGTTCIKGECVSNDPCGQ